MHLPRGMEDWLARKPDGCPRTRMQNWGICSKDTHVVLEIRFSSLGVAHYTTLCQGPDYGFRSTLQKMSYRGATDWKVWHFHADLPLEAYDEQGNLLVTSSLKEII